MLATTNLLPATTASQNAGRVRVRDFVKRFGQATGADSNEGWRLGLDARSQRAA